MSELTPGPSVADVLALTPEEESGLSDIQKGYYSAICCFAAIAVDAYKREEAPIEWTDSVVEMCKAMRDNFLQMEDLT